MTKDEAIAIIERALPSADEATLQAAARLFRDASVEVDDLPRPLTEGELQSIEQGKRDFEAGRTYTSDEVRAYLADRRAQRSAERTKA